MINAANQGNLALGMGNIRASQYGGYGSALGQALQMPGVQNYLRQATGGIGFGTGLGYGNEDYGQYFG